MTDSLPSMAVPKVASKRTKTTNGEKEWTSISLTVKTRLKDGTKNPDAEAIERALSKMGPDKAKSMRGIVALINLGRLTF